MNKKIKTEQVEYFGYKIDYQGYVDVIREHNPDEEYSGEETHTSWDISRHLTIDNKYPDVAVPFQLEGGKDYYLVYVIYNTSDSFSRHDGSNIEFIEIFETYDKANSLVEQIQENSGKEITHNEYLDEKDHKKNISYVWNGYFESLHTCSLMTVSAPILEEKDTINPKKNKKSK